MNRGRYSMLRVTIFREGGSLYYDRSGGHKIMTGGRYSVGSLNFVTVAQICTCIEACLF